MLPPRPSTTAPRAAGALLLALWLLPAAAAATVVVPMSDAELADRSPLIVEARVLAVEPAPGERPATDYLVQIERWIKGRPAQGRPAQGRPAQGRPAGDALLVRVPGGVRPDGVGLHLWGAPRFREGDDALLFLAPGGGGTFVLSQFLLGAFRLTGEAPYRIATRDLSAATVITPPGRAAPGSGPRDLEKLRRWLSDRAEGRLRPPDYFLPAPAVRPEALAEKFRTPVTSNDPPPLGCGSNGGHSLRWFDFDLGGRVGWRSHFSGQPGVAGGGVEALREALASWTRDPNTPIDYGWDGLTATTGGLTAPDGVNAFLFGDPNDELGGSFDGAGLLAAGGPWFDCGLLGHEGERYHPIFAADVVTQDGLERFFAAFANPARAAEQVFAHELGHTLGLAHSMQPEALMVADFHADGRGAALEADDLAGVLHLYGPRGLSPPAAPSGLRATAGEALAVAIEWSDNSGNESLFRLERREVESEGDGEGEGFGLLATVAADATSFVDSGVAPETLYAYRLRADNGGGASAYTDVAEVLTPEDPRPAAPSNLRAAPLSSSEIRLAWQDNSGDETAFVVAIELDSAWVDIPYELPAGTRKAIVEGLTPGARFRFRVRAFNAFGASAPSNPAATETFASDDACVVTGEELCLLGGRFKVSAEYRNQHVAGEAGPATVVPSTDESGLFWFFGPENVELIVKVLDGRHINQHFWTFYGALSDLEYKVTVTETSTGATEIYHNPPGEVCGRADTAAFPGNTEEVPSAATAAASFAAATLDVAALTLVAEEAEEDPAPTAAGPCAPGPERLCLLDGRLAVDVVWKNHHDGTQGSGRAIVDTDNTGFFWFFNIENTELVVKALDGGALNGRLWIFYGALTDLEYSLAVTDTATGESRLYHNPPGEVCGRADVDAFPAVPEEPEEPPDDDGPEDPSLP